jgi:hypothetical protein
MTLPNILRVLVAVSALQGDGFDATKWAFVSRPFRAKRVTFGLLPGPAAQAVTWRTFSPRQEGNLVLFVRRVRNLRADCGERRL